MDNQGYGHSTYTCRIGCTGPYQHRHAGKNLGGCLADDRDRLVSFGVGRAGLAGFADDRDGIAGRHLFILRNTLAPLLTEAVGIPVSTRATQGPDENILLLESGEVQLAFVTTGSALQAWNGTASWTHGKKLWSMRALFPMYNTPFQFVALDSSGISILRDMGNKQVGVGPQGGTGGLYANKIFEVLGIPAAVQYGAWSTMSRQMRSGVLDAIVGTAGAPFP
jgi:TRAP transporter TAXI family solute receptor